MIKLGISAFYHDSSACIVKDNKVIAAAEEERFTGKKHDYSFPKNAIRWVLRECNLNIKDIDEVCWYENPILKKDRVLNTFKKRPIKTFWLKKKFNKTQKKQDIVNILNKWGFEGNISFTPHHLSHAKFSYFSSPYNESAILTVDGVGEWATTVIYHAKGNSIDEKISIDFPNSLGMLYSTITSFLGFKPNEGEYKVMGLAPYGNPEIYYNKLRKVFKNTSNKYWINQNYFTWEYSDKIMFNKKLCQLLDLQPRLPEDLLEQDHKNLAAALQKIYEEEFLKLVITAKNITGSENLCLGGGCAYNGVANSLAYKHFRSIHIPFAPSDAGSAIGACLNKHTIISPYLGPNFSNNGIKKELKRFEDKLIYFRMNDFSLLKKVAEIIEGGKIVAWFQGKMEFGARALGNRSILATPGDPFMREKLNKVIKKRESFRPFAPSVIEEAASKYFDIKEPIPYMNQVVQSKTKVFPSATHIDNSCRVQTVNKEQNPRYYKLLKEIEKVSGYPVVLNTSFNLKDQTITISPLQAIERFVYSDIDYLVLNNFLIRKK